MKKVIFVLCLILGISSMCLAASENVSALINRKVKVLFEGEVQEFQNVNGVKVYPLSYDGTTYLPIRAISSLFGTEIKWDSQTNSVYLGEGELDETAAKTAEEFVAGENENIEVLRNEDISIYFYDEIQTFADANGKTVYPLSYEGTTYLPVRAVSGLFNLSIDWDAENNAVLITEDPEVPVDDFESDEELDDSGEVLEDTDIDAENEEEEEDVVIDVDLDSDEEAIEIDEADPSFIDENGNEVYYYYTDDGDVYYYYFDENDDFISYYYDEEGGIVYLYE